MTEMSLDVPLAEYRNFPSGEIMMPQGRLPALMLFNTLCVWASTTQIVPARPAPAADFHCQPCGLGFCLDIDAAEPAKSVGRSRETQRASRHQTRCHPHAGKSVVRSLFRNVGRSARFR